jgi:hypothetical protein
MQYRLDDKTVLEIENGRLVKVNGSRPDYMDGSRLIRLVKELAEALVATKTLPEIKGE